MRVIAPAHRDDVAAVSACLTRSGYSRRRRVRSLGAHTPQVRPRRARCPCCLHTRILLPALQPRLADTTEVIGTALAGKAAGRGHRRIAADAAPWATPICNGCGSAAARSSPGSTRRCVGARSNQVFTTWRIRACSRRQRL